MFDSGGPRTPEWLAHYTEVLTAHGCSDTLTELALRASRDVARLAVTVDGDGCHHLHPNCNEIGSHRSAAGAHTVDSTASEDTATPETAVTTIAVLGHRSVSEKRLLRCHSGVCAPLWNGADHLLRIASDLAQLTTTLRRIDLPSWPLDMCRGNDIETTADTLSQVRRTCRRVDRAIDAGVWPGTPAPPADPYDTTATEPAETGARGASAKERRKHAAMTPQSIAAARTLVELDGAIWPDIETTRELLAHIRAAVEPRLLRIRHEQTTHAARKLVRDHNGTIDDEILTALQVTICTVTLPDDLPRFAAPVAWFAKYDGTISDEYAATLDGWDAVIARCGSDDGETLTAPLAVLLERRLLRTAQPADHHHTPSWVPILATLLCDAGGDTANIADMYTAARLLSDDADTPVELPSQLSPPHTCATR